MTHTLHRLGEAKSLEKDYVILSMAAQKFNDRGARHKLAQTLKILAKYSPVNLADDNQGGIYTGKTIEELLDNMTDKAYIGAVFTDENTLEKALRELKEASLGMSVVVSGPFKKVFEVAKRVGLRPHTVHMSLGVFGSVNLLPDKDILEITTMCGHGMITPRCVEKVIKKVTRGKMDSKEAAKDLAKLCTCGIFNVERAAQLIEKICAARSSKGGN